MLKLRVDLEDVFDSCKWDRKYQAVPRNGIVATFRDGEASKAAQYIKSHKQETSKCYRSLMLYSDSKGQALSVVQDDWE